MKIMEEGMEEKAQVKIEKIMKSLLKVDRFVLLLMDKRLSTSLVQMVIIENFDTVGDDVRVGGSLSCRWPPAHKRALAFVIFPCELTFFFAIIFEGMILVVA